VHQSLQQLRRNLLGCLKGSLLVFFDKQSGLLEDLCLLEQSPCGIDPFAIRQWAILGDDMLQESDIVGREPLHSEGQENGWSPPQKIRSRLHLVVLIPLPISQVVEDLEGNPQIPRELPHRFRWDRLSRKSYAG
jgi:hypothetical protein